MSSLSAFAWVAAGGAIGACGRYAASLALASSLVRFPFATLTVNILGSFLLGLVLAVSQQYPLPESLRLFLAVGVLGALTTFSTFSVEVVNLVQQGTLGKALLHVGLNVVISIAAVVAAMVLVNSLSNISVK